MGFVEVETVVTDPATGELRHYRGHPDGLPKAPDAEIAPEHTPEHTPAVADPENGLKEIAEIDPPEVASRPAVEPAAGPASPAATEQPAAGETPAPAEPPPPAPPEPAKPAKKLSILGKKG